MISNPNSRATLQAEWQGVVRMRERITQLVFSTSAFNAKSSPSFGDILYNLPLHLAFEVLIQALLQAKDEGYFTNSQRQLADLMDSAKTAFEWIDWDFLWEGLKGNGEVAEGGQLFEDRQC